MFKIIQAFFLTTNTITEELKEYCHLKNIDTAILLSKRYYEFLNVFFKKKADIFFIHRLYNHAINLKNSYYLASTVMYRMSGEEI